MANGKLNLGKQSGGVLSLTFPDGVTNTEVVLPESGTVVSIDNSVTDNAVARYDGTTGKLQGSGVVIDDGGNLLLTSGTGALGYRAGAGGTVTQLTSKSTAVTLNKPSGMIIMNASALAAGESVYFTVYNSLITTNDTVTLTMGGTTINTRYTVFPTFSALTGRFYIIVKNIYTGSLAEALVINFTITKGATA